MSRSAQPFGRYELLERISAGGMAEVFRATDKAKDHIVALKRILPQIAEDEEFVAMFEDEARIASQLEHPHIARMLDFGRIDDSYYIAFEYVNGRDLRALFDRCVRMGEFPPLSFLLYTFARIGEGLAYAHARRDDNGQPQSIVHRDVSPQNIMVSFDGDVKLIDFGIAKAAGKLSRTQVGTLKGKFGYMAPEQIRGTEIDHRTDLFSLGICMWELLTLERLFYAENELLVLEKVRSATIAPPSTKNRDIPPELDRIVLKALAKDVRERYGAAKDVFRDLDKLAKSIDGAATREEIARYMRRAFPESLARKPTPSDVGPVTRNTARVNQESTMAADIPSSDKRGSDLDIFEGLGKKNSSAPSRAPSAPPPPPSRAVANPPMVIKNDMAKKTLVGIAPASITAAQAQVVAAQAAQNAGAGPQRILTPQPRSAPPPPPGRGSLPQVVPPPPRASVNPPPAAMSTPQGAPPANSSAPTRASAAPPGTAAAKAGLDMDWDDEDEATHVFDKAPTMEEPATDRPPRPAAGTPLAPPVNTLKGGISAPSIPAPPPSRQSATPPPPPSRQSAPPPPPSSLNAFARSSGAPPPPPMFPAPSTLPSQSAPAMPPQVSTAPMPMPGRSAPPPSMNGGQMGQGGFLSSASPNLPPVTGAPMLGSRMEATQLVRPKESGKAGMIGAAIAIAAIAAGLVVFLMMPRTGRIAVNVADIKGVTINRVEIFVDGKKQCETAPCIVDQVSAGAHEVKVLAVGYDTPADRAVSVEARKDATLDYSLTGVNAQAGTGIKVSGNQPGVKLFVDAVEIGPLPQEIHTLKPGMHTIRLTGTDRYAPLEKNVTVALNEVQDLGDQTLKVVKGKATITLGTPGAKVSIVSGTDRREFPTLPIAVDLDTTKAWALEASKVGFADYHQAVSFDDGVAEKAFNITLDPKTVSMAAAPPAPVAAAAPAPPPRAPAIAQRSAPKEKDTSDDAPGSASAAPSGEGFLNINSLPASQVTLDGKLLGNTPKVHVPVSAGSHTVIFTNNDQGLKKQISVSVGAGETKPAIAKLRE